MHVRNRTVRVLSMLISLAMLLSMLPTTILAAGGETLRGESVTVEVAQEGSLQRENDFNKGWKFYLGTSSTAQNKNFDDSSWKSVNLPHDFSITQSFTTSGEAESGFLPGGTGWYRKTFTMPADAAGKTILLNFDGVYSDAYVYVNGSYVAEHHYGYTSFAVDLSDSLVCDGVTENVVAVKAVNNIPTSRWYSGSGIYRDVTLMVADPVHVDWNGMTVTTPDVASGSGTVQVKTQVVNRSAAAANVTVTSTVYKKGGDEALASDSSTVYVAAGADAEASVSPLVRSYDLWSIETPNLYEVRTELSVDGQVVDTAQSEFGFRWFSFDSNGFHLNGKNVKLQGVCMHHDQGALGSAAYYDAMYRQISIMKDMGVNAIRTAHNPADQDYIAICNELGILVIEEVFDGLVDPKNENSNDFSSHFESSVSTGLYGASSGMTCAEFAARSVVSRDKNAPCIIAWSFGNEIQEGTYWNNVSRYASICSNFIQWVNDEDGTRPITSGDNDRGASSELVNVITTITNSGGVAGFNYANTASKLYSLAQSYGGSTGCIIAAETSSATNSRSVYKSQTSNSSADGKYHLTSYDTSCVTWGITAHDSIYNTYQYDCVAGEFVWTGFDYIGEPTPWNGTVSGSVSGSGAMPNSSYFGIVETTGFEKDTYYLYRSQWNKDETTLHLVTAWDSDNMMTSSGKTPVWVYSNAPVVKLYRNGTLIGTATRSTHTSSAGHVYYTYTTSSNNTSVCTTSSGSGSAGLYAVFNVTYASGTLSAKAFDTNGNEISLSGNSGKNTVTTPDTASCLVLSQNRTEMAADGSSLTYITVDVTDANGNLDTTATNNISFTLQGNGEIVGVDNGDQATTAKYQQSSVLKSANAANINAYAGKALVIVRSTEETGTIQLTASASGLTGGSVYVETKAVENTTTEGMASYTMVKDYSVKAGTVPVLDTVSNGVLSDGTAVSGTITWEEVPASQYQTAGDYTINGTLTFDGFNDIAVTARLHVIADVIALRNVSTATTAGAVPALPSVVSGVLADGTLSGEFAVTWDTVSADDLMTVGDLVTVSGTAAIFGEETKTVTCTIRVAEEIQSESSNIAPQAMSLTQDIAAGKQSDNLDSVINGTTNPGDNTDERWSNWNNRTTSADATLTLTWATAHRISSVNLYYYYDNCSAYPETVQFSYSLNGEEYTQIDATEELVESYSLGAEYTYTFAKPVNPVGLQIKLTQQNGTTGSNCVALTELEVMTYQGALEYSADASLSAIAVDGVDLEGFAPDTLEYTGTGAVVTARSDSNAAITVLPAEDSVVRILVISEDGSVSRVYSVTLDQSCAHSHTEVRNQKDASCTEDGYTGDLYCTDCEQLLSSGTVVTAAGHSWGEWQVTTEAACTTNGVQTRTCTVCQEQETQDIAATGHLHIEVRDAQEAGCETEGYTGDTWCSDCNTKLKTGTVIAAYGHKWDNGVVTKEATEEEPGVRLYTCSLCGNTRTEEIPYEKALKVPGVTLKVTATASGKLALTAQVKDYENLDDYYPITSHGIVYMQTFRLDNRTLTVNTSGRTKVNFSSYKSDGSYVYNMTPTYRTISYTVRAYLSYVDPTTGRTVYVYSDKVVGSYNSLK